MPGNAIQYISKIIYLIESDYKKIFFTLYFISSIFDLIGLGTLLIFIQGILNYDNFINSQFLQNISLFFPYLHLSKINFFFIIGLFLLTIFFIKTLISIYVQAKIIDYSLSKERILRNKLINHYINLDYLEFTKKNH